MFCIVFIIVMVVFYYFVVFFFEFVDEDMVVGGGCVWIYINFVVYILYIFYCMYYGVDCREFGFVFYNWISRCNFKRVQVLCLFWCDLECVSICDDWNFFFIGRIVF